jgi:sugar phosphate isomerase/epimerase
MSETMSFTDFGMDTASLAGSLEAKLAALAEAGFTQVMVSAADLVDHPRGADAALRAIRASGLAVTGLQALADYEGLAGHLHQYKVDVAKALLELCHALGSRLLLVEASKSAHASHDPAHIASDLAKLALLAVPLGIRIAFKGLAASRTAAQFVAAADHVLEAGAPNLGLAIDSFDTIAAHIAAEELDAIDPAAIFLVQLSDFMWPDLDSDEERRATALHFRVFPGEGMHSEAIADFVTRLDRIGFAGHYSFDVYNDDYRQLPPLVVARRARRAALWLGESVLRRSLPVPNLKRLRAAS